MDMNIRISSLMVPKYKLALPGMKHPDNCQECTKATAAESEMSNKTHHSRTQSIGSDGRTWYWDAECCSAHCSSVKWICRVKKKEIKYLYDPVLLWTYIFLVSLVYLYVFGKMKRKNREKAKFSFYTTFYSYFLYFCRVRLIKNQF